MIVKEIDELILWCDLCNVLCCVVQRSLPCQIHTVHTSVLVYDGMLSSQTHPPVHTWAKVPLRTTPICISDRQMKSPRRASTYPLIEVEENAFQRNTLRDVFVLYQIGKIQSGVCFCLIHFLLLFSSCVPRPYFLLKHIQGVLLSAR